MHPRQFPKQQPPRDNWRVEMVEQKTEDGLVLFEYAIREPQKEPFLLNNHKAQIRTNHQRVVTGPNGGLMHVSGVEVLDHEEFERGTEFYRWVGKDRSGNWRDDRGRTLAPFVFPSAPWAGGVDEELDPQWVRETFTLTVESQASECIERYQKRAERKAYVGDRRGTTLNLQVAASADDAWQLISDEVRITETYGFSDTTTQHIGVRFAALEIDGSATIDDAIFSVAIFSSINDEPNHQVRGELSVSAAQFTTTTNDIDARARTIASVNWEDQSGGLGSASNAWQEWGCTVAGGAGLTIESVIQEVIDQGSWSSGNPLVLISEQFSNNTSNDLQIHAYDGNTSLAPKLDIDYTSGTPPATTRRYSLSLTGVG